MSHVRRVAKRGGFVENPITGQRAEFSQAKFWHYGPFSPLATSPQLTQFVVLDCEMTAPKYDDSGAKGGGVASSGAIARSSICGGDHTPWNKTSGKGALN